MQKTISVNCTPKIHYGTLRLWAHVQVERGAEWERSHYKKLTLQTIHQVRLEDDKDNYISEFKDLNPGFSDVAINYEFTLRQYG
jgi:hypothetical protein